AHRWPQFLPGGTFVLFVAATGAPNFRPNTPEGQIIVQSLGDGTRKVLAQGSYARYVRSGHLIYLQGRTLLAAPFDVPRLELTGPSVRVLDGVKEAVAAPLS